MTERWRKKLHELDAVGPRDEVFEQAKTRPVNVDAAVQRSGTTTRVVTGVAAIAFFLAAVGVFAIPALRMRTSQIEGPQQSVPATDTSARWVTYDGRLGFTLEIPSNWGTTSITDEVVLSAPTGEPYVQIVRVPEEQMYRDDSSFPLDYSSLASRSQPHFYGDGQTFIIQWLTGSAAAPTDEDVSVFDRITRSISFEPWSVGEQRNGLTAIAQPHPAATAEWFIFHGARFVSYFGGDGGREALGPAPSCRTGQGLYEIRQTGIAAVTCQDGEVGEWDFASGAAQPKNAALFASPLTV